jgi:dTDP-4-dehydrorhamnose 3,5-epimerase/CDP-3, 6-dideoxy-D-glycero-D-glycero-4-hexulose-5-epimerase
MTIEKTILDGVLILNNFFAEDKRGVFVKTFNSNNFSDNNINFEIRESYFSISQKDVIRGMHFQLPPHDHQKLVYVPQGAIIDVVVDLRKDSETYKKFISVELSQENRKSIFIPKGMAHGFKSLEDNTITVYNVSTVYNPDSDSGIRFDSFGFDWITLNPIISKRDMNLDSMHLFDSKNPF